VSERSSDDQCHHACTECLRRSWLLRELSGVLDCSCRESSRLFEVLGIEDQALLKALAGRRHRELLERYERFRAGELPRASGVYEFCRHDPRYPPGLRGDRMPPALFATGDPARLSESLGRPIVAIVGTHRATDYGLQMAGALARGLAACGVTVTGEVAEGIGRAVHAGTLEGGGAPLAVLPGGLDVAPPPATRELLRAIRELGAAVSELPCGTPSRPWATSAAKRIVAGLARLSVVVEAEDTRRELAGARAALTLGRGVAALPGRVTSRASRGCHTLLAEGATLVTGTSDVLDALYGAKRAADVISVVPERLEPRLRSVLELVGAGVDTPGKLVESGTRAGAVLQALAELELRGLLARGEGGRYVPCDPLGGADVRYRVPSQMEP
jgi:DNA processing protein